MTPFDHWINRYLRRLAFGRFLQRSAEWLAAFLFAYGALILVVKLALPTLWPQVLWVGLGAIPVAVSAAFASRRGAFSRAESVALLDQKLETGGLLMSLSERPDPRWAERLPQMESAWRDSLPRVRPVRFAKYLALPLIFAVGACLAPLRAANTDLPLKRTAGQQAAERLEQALEIIEQAAILPEQEQEELMKELERLAADAREKPLTQERWETIDALQQKIQSRLETAQRTVAKAQDAVTLLAQAQEAGHISEAQIAELEAELKEAMADLKPQGEKAQPDASQENAEQPSGENQQGTQPQEGPSEGSPEQGTQQQPIGGAAQPPQNGELSQDPGERQQQLQQLSEFLNQESQRLSQARNDSSQAMDGGEQAQGGDSPSSSPSGDVPGSGSPTEGSGDAEMSFGNASDEQNAKFKEIVLPPGERDEMQDRTIGVTAQDPEVKPVESAPRNALRDNDPAAGQETWNRTVRPRHRSAVRGYFGEQE